MAIPVQRNAASDSTERVNPSGGVTPPAGGPREPGLDTWDKTDRPLTFPKGHSHREDSNPPEGGHDPERRRWLQEHDIRTEFVDAGIGCRWFAQQGDGEPVIGDTEDEAIERLVREHQLA